MNNFILGTAGHIDHGKTALIKALTGIDCDTHPEEKQRGITINLGFSHLDLPDGNSIGIVDVPGHHDFVNTMVAGAHGIDILMLVIAADSGIMPQTIEHLQISQTLGINHGFVTLTKTDLVDEETLSLIETEIKEYLQDSFLKGCKIVRTSAVTGDGVQSLKNYLTEIVKNSRGIEKSKIFRMYIDRIFSVAGFGTVVTGSVLGGMISKNDKIFLLPVNKELRIRRMERHGKEVEQISSGNRVSLNLIGLNKEEFEKGMLLSDRYLKPTIMLDAKMQIFKSAKKIEAWSDALFLTGTYKNQAKMHLIDTNSTEAGSSVIVQIHLTEPCIVLRGDKFIVRDTSGLKTLGGGQIIDPYPLHHRRRTKKIIEQLKKISDENSLEFIFSELRKTRNPISIRQLKDEYLLTDYDVKQITTASLPGDIIRLNSGNDSFLLVKAVKEKIVNDILNKIQAFHKMNPMIEKGRTFKELESIVDKKINVFAEPVLNVILTELVAKNKLKQIENTWALANHHININNKESEEINFVEKFFIDSKLNTPSFSELVINSKKIGIDKKKLNQILNMLVETGRLYRVDNNYLHKSLVDDCRYKLLKELNKNSKGLTVAGFRDLIGGNRKICLLLLNLFDTEGVTIRMDDVRNITEKGRKILVKNG